MCVVYVVCVVYATSFSPSSPHTKMIPTQESNILYFVVGFVGQKEQKWVFWFLGGQEYRCCGGRERKRGSQIVR